jgi:ABC-2 type transport system permease protein
MADATLTAGTDEVIPAPGRQEVHARKAGFLSDLLAVAGRAIRAIPREPESVIPALIVPLFFFVVNVGSLQNITEFVDPGFDYKAFQLPVAIIFAVTGVSRASALVTDIQTGYFDRLLMTPINRLTLLLGLMIADFVLVVALSVPVVVLGLVLGVGFAAGPLGILMFVLMAGCWGVVYTGFPYAIALKTGNPAAVNSSFILFFPFAFLTTTFVPKEALTGWLSAIATWNPVTYLLEGLRSLIFEGWVWQDLLQGGAAVLGVGLVSIPLALWTLRGRVRRG